MANDITIRPIAPGEITDDLRETLVDLSVTAWKPIYDQYRRTTGEDLFLTLYPDWRENKAGHIRRALEVAHDPGLAVAECDGQVVGFVTWYLDVGRKGIGEIGNNAVRPDQQGKGIASRLYELAMDEMRAAGMRYAKVGTGLDPAHAPARRAYEKAGFDIAIPSVEYYRTL
jgi:GNAT superfamily N-acetyltransferase